MIIMIKNCNSKSTIKRLALSATNNMLKVDIEPQTFEFVKNAISYLALYWIIGM